MFECHITFPPAFPTWAELENYAKKNGWTVSAYDGDPVLGKGKRNYLTANSNDQSTLVLKMANALIDVPGALRAKIEQTLLDTKFPADVNVPEK